MNTNKHLPNSELKASRTSSTYKVERVLEDSNELVINISSISDKKLSNLKIGQKTKIYNSGDILVATGCILAINSSNRILLSSVVYEKDINSEDIVFDDTYICKFSKWWSANIPNFEIVNEEAFYEVLEEPRPTLLLSANTEFKGKHIPGLISWTLYYASNKESKLNKIIIGNDLLTPGICTFSKPGYIWKAGYYVLKAERYSKSSKVLLKKDSVNWTQDVSTETLACGGYSDVVPALSL